MIVTLDAGLRTALVLAAMAKSLTGTVVGVESGPPARLVMRAEQQFQTLDVSPNAVIERESRFAGGGGEKISQIALPDLTPGEYVEVSIDPGGNVTRARATVQVERAKVRSASGSEIVLDDGTKLTIGSILRFVDAEGKASKTATVEPGDTVLLFHHPLTRNIYRVEAAPPPKAPCPTPDD